MLTRFLPVFILTLLLASCTSREQANIEMLQEAKQAIAKGDNKNAKRLADELINTEGNTLTAQQYAELSIIYMQLSEADDMEDNTATAYQCYRNAFKADSVAAQSFYTELPPETSRYAQMLAELVRQLDNPSRNDIPDHEEEYAAPHIEF